MMPKADAVRAVAARFRGLLEEHGDGRVDSRERRAACIDEETGLPCGSHPGMYRLAIEMEGLRPILAHKSLTPTSRAGHFNIRAWELGAAQLAEDLGFWGALELQAWAEGYPVIWGVPKGFTMFNWNAHIAFAASRTNFRLSRIVEHWAAVAGRLDRFEELEADHLAMGDRTAGYRDRAAMSAIAAMGGRRGKA